MTAGGESHRWGEFFYMKNIFKKDENVRVYKILDTEGLKKILFPVLEKFYPQNVLNIIRSDDDLLFGTPFFAYIFLLQKYHYLNHNSSFRELTITKKLEYFIIDRGAGNDTAFSREEKESMLQIPVSNYNDIIFIIIDKENSSVQSNIGYPWELAKKKFFSEVAPAIEKAYLVFHGISSLE